MTMFGFHKDAVATPCEPGVTRRILAYDQSQMLCEVSFEKGAKGNFHSHPHDQITYVAKGAFLFTIEEETRELHQGDSVRIPSQATHGVTCLEEGILVDVFSPYREDFLK